MNKIYKLNTKKYVTVKLGNFSNPPAIFLSKTSLEISKKIAMFSYVIEFLRCDYAGCNPSIFLNAIARFSLALDW